MEWLGASIRAWRQEVRDWLQHDFGEPLCDGTGHLLLGFRIDRTDSKRSSSSLCARPLCVRVPDAFGPPMKTRTQASALRLQDLRDSTPRCRVRLLHSCVQAEPIDDCEAWALRHCSARLETVVLCRVAYWDLTFDMSGGRKHAKRAGVRPLDGGVRFRRTYARGRMCTHKLMTTHHANQHCD
jgi:hypothetical protein